MTPTAPTEGNAYMRRKLGYVVAAAAMVGGTMIGTAGTAAADHCTDRGRPGNSDFSVHVRANNGPGGHNEGDHFGWSTCEPQAQSG